jgi:PAS domain-containing protein
MSPKPMGNSGLGRFGLGPKLCDTTRGGVVIVADPSQEDPTPERKLADDALRDSEARYRRLFEAAPDGILILDGYSGLITDVNPYLISLLDYPRE